MKYMLDSNVCVHYLNKKTDAIEKRLKYIVREDITVCSIVKAELFFGAMKSSKLERTLLKQQKFLNQFYSYPFDDKAAEVYARLRADLYKVGKPIGPNDFLIASICLANDLILVTHNTDEFSRVAGLRLEDWEV